MNLLRVWSPGRWGGAAVFVLLASAAAAQAIYLVGDWRAAHGPAAYALADFLAGPVGAACLVGVFGALREEMGTHAPRRMSLALAAAILAAAAMLLVACVRAANRQYHLQHPELHLENATLVLTVWATLVAGIGAAGWHCLGWALLLAGAAGWTSDRWPRGLCAAVSLAGLAGLFVYAWPGLEEAASALGAGCAVWQGILFLRAVPGEKPA